MTLSENQIETIRENTENLELSDQELKDLQDKSWITEKQFVVYVLSESGMTQQDIADVMGYSDPGTVSGYKSRVKDKIEKSKTTLEVEEIFDSIKSRLEKVYPDHELVSYSRLSNSLLSECPECGEKELEQEHDYYPENDSYIECKACGSEFDFKYENNMWIKKREESKSN